MLKRLLFAVVPVIFASTALVLTTTATAAAHGKCHHHGYSHGHCKSVSPGSSSTVTVPGLPVNIQFSNKSGSIVEVEAAAVAAPPGAPSGSQCFSAHLFSGTTGQEVSSSSPLVFQTSGTVFAFNSSAGTFSALARGSSGNAHALNGGIFCVAISAAAVGLPATGGAV